MRRRLLRAARSTLAGLGLALVLAGCAAAPVRQPLPARQATPITAAGVPESRYWADETPRSFERWRAMSEAELRERYGGILDRPHAYLLLSGGGGDGAFGAGLLAGWTAHGTRPEFQYVTGISTGALIAPFAFLGPAYDERLRELYTTLRTRDLVRQRNIFKILTGNSAFDTTPLRRLLEKNLGEAEIAAIGREGQRGRSLLIGTTHLDASRPVIWDITRIAAAGTPAARKLIYDVILASISIPGAFPPVLIDVEMGGRRYDELHVDGGVTAQLFFGPDGLDWKQVASTLRVQGQPQIYIVRNSRLKDRWTAVDPRLVPIMSRTIATLIRNQGIGDLARIYIAAQRAGLGFNLASVPTDFDRQPAELFDPAYMRALYERGYALARDGYPWIRECGRRARAAWITSAWRGSRRGRRLLPR
jgi:hypothetical protein